MGLYGSYYFGGSKVFIHKKNISGFYKGLTMDLIKEKKMKEYFHKPNINSIELQAELNAFSEQGWEIYKLWKTVYDIYEIVACRDKSELIGLK